MREYRIGDYAHYMGVTPDLLKHYEQFGLVTSNTRENGYRYYPFYQSSKLLECMKLRSYGIPLRDMGDILNEDSAQKVQERLAGQVEEMKRRLVFEQAVVEEYARFSRWLERMQDKQGDWQIRECEEMYFLPHSNQYDFLEDSRIYDVLRDWVSWMPMVKSCKEIRTLGSSDYSWGLIVAADFARKQGIPLNGAVRHLPRRKVLFCDFRGDVCRVREEVRVFGDDYVRETMDRLGLKPAGSMYKVMLMYGRIDREEFCEYGFFAVPVEAL